MMRLAVLASVFTLWLAASINAQTAKVSIVVDLDPASVERTVIVESITADKDGRLYLPDRVSGNILRVDPKSPKPTAVAKIAPRQRDGKPVQGDGAGVAFSQQGDLFVASAPFSEILRIRGAELNPEKPGVAETFATGTEGANGIVFDKQGNLFVSGGRSGKVFRIAPNGGAAQPAVQIEPHARKLPDGKTEQANVANGLEIDAAGNLYVADSARGAIWKVAMSPDGNAGKPAVFAESPLLEGVDGLAFDAGENLWAVANERNALLTVSAERKIQELAKNDSKGPLEFPSAIVFVGKTGYISNYDTPRRDNLDGNGKTAFDGVGASIAQVSP